MYHWFSELPSQPPCRSSYKVICLNFPYFLAELRTTVQLLHYSLSLLKSNHCHRKARIQPNNNGTTTLAADKGSAITTQNSSQS